MPESSSWLYSMFTTGLNRLLVFFFIRFRIEQSGRHCSLGPDRRLVRPTVREGCTPPYQAGHPCTAPMEDSKQNIPSFIGKLSCMLQEGSASAYIRWAQSGDSIVVRDPSSFATAMLPRLCLRCVLFQKPPRARTCPRRPVETSGRPASQGQGRRPASCWIHVERVCGSPEHACDGTSS